MNTSQAITVSSGAIITPARTCWWRAARYAGTILTCAALLAGCGETNRASEHSALPLITDEFDPASLPEPETFLWGSQPISVSPPPADWYRERTTDGGLRGARFIKSRSFGEEIRIAEHIALDERLRCTTQVELLEQIDDIGPREFSRSIQRAKMHVPNPINLTEERAAQRVNDMLDDARTAFQAGDRHGARRALRQAIDQTRNVRYSLDEVADRVMFNPESYDSFGTVETQSPKSLYVGGVPAIAVDYTLDSSENGHLYVGRQVYVLENNRLFVLTFHGLQRSLAVFEAIVNSVSFPRSHCSI